MPHFPITAVQLIFNNIFYQLTQPLKVSSSLRPADLTWTGGYVVQHCPHVFRRYCNISSESLSFQDSCRNEHGMTAEDKQKDLFRVLEEN